MFLTLIIHELTHLLFLMKNRIAVSKITIEPFGVSIIAKSENIDTIWVYLSAPLLNLAVGAAFSAFLEKNYYANYFMLSNITLGLFNLLPVIPFDGGRALELVLSKKFSKINRISYKISFITSVILIVFGCYLVYITKFNLSVIIIGIFLLYNSISERALVTERLTKHYAGLEKRGKLSESLPIVNLAVPKNYPYHKLIKKFMPGSYYIVKIIDNGVVIKTLTETQIIKALIS